MNLKELKELIDLFTSKDSIEELEIEKSGVRLKMKRSIAPAVPSASPSPVSSIPVASIAPAVSPSEARKTPVETDDLFYVKAPIVGTFYKSPNPASPPFVSVGDVVEKGTVLCIVEAMKLMNEIEAEVAGQITAILVENGQPVEYGEKLFSIRPR
jgi:oxaloacetate decarboxylase (Na+ extruding) subunit alpha